MKGDGDGDTISKDGASINLSNKTCPNDDLNLVGAEQQVEIKSADKWALVTTKNGGAPLPVRGIEGCFSPNGFQLLQDMREEGEIDEAEEVEEDGSEVEEEEVNLEESVESAVGEGQVAGTQEAHNKVKMLADSIEDDERNAGAMATKKQSSSLWGRGRGSKRPIVNSRGLAHAFPIVLNAETADGTMWKNGPDDYGDKFLACSTWHQIRQRKDNLQWSKLVWFSQGVFHYAFITWLAFRDRLATGHRTSRWGQPQCCMFCGEPDETREHLYFACPYTYTLWLQVVDKRSEQVEMLLPPLCLLGLSLVSPGNFTDLGCRLRLLRKHLRKESQKRGSQRLCSDYYDQDGETRSVVAHHPRPSATSYSAKPIANNFKLLNIIELPEVAAK
ncbi:hypothetical protein F2Q68_00008803 [Brassica cretica]|uniref:Reverse transcriptase zinc-binding domain-containing protein n=1 Tax=Brassica cretica TaxID=69181 RepID=A0A8S9KT70_BRACR|nr:hypothetical protein F2Q68_00008803 [Brassica cretica]